MQLLEKAPKGLPLMALTTVIAPRIEERRALSEFSLVGVVGVGEFRPAPLSRWGADVIRSCFLGER